MPKAPASAAATGWPEFDPDAFDLDLHHMGQLLDLIAGHLNEIDRTDGQPATAELRRLDSLAWISRNQIRQLSAQFEVAAFPRNSNEVHS